MEKNQLEFVFISHLQICCSMLKLRLGSDNYNQSSVPNRFLFNLADSTNDHSHNMSGSM